MNVNKSIELVEPVETTITYQPIIVVPPVFPERGPPRLPDIPQPMPLAERLLPIIPIVGVVVVVIAGAIGGVIVGVVGGVVRFLNRKKQAKKAELLSRRNFTRPGYRKYKLQPKPYEPLNDRKSRQASRTGQVGMTPQATGLPLLSLENMNEWMQRVRSALDVDPDVVIDFP